MTKLDTLVWRVGCAVKVDDSDIIHVIDNCGIEMFTIACNHRGFLVKRSCVVTWGAVNCLGCIAMEG